MSHPSVPWLQSRGVPRYLKPAGRNSKSPGQVGRAERSVQSQCLFEPHVRNSHVPVSYTHLTLPTICSV
eukprot:1227177-Alexandrium_andersonii.AAC.1